MPSVAQLDAEYKEYVLKDTFTFWQETDAWPIYEKPHRQLCREIDDAMPDMTKQRKKPLATVELAPRFSYKTYVECKAIARMVLKYPNISIGIFRSTRDESRKMLSLVKNILSINPVVRRLFGDLSKGAEKWDEDAIIVNTRTIARTDPTVFTMGTSGTSTGNHPDGILADDLVTEINCDSPSQQQTLWDYIDAFQPQLPDHGALLLVGTRWSEIDAYGKAIALNELKRKEGVAIEDLPWKIHIHQAYETLADGSIDLYFPAYLTQERLDDMKSKVDSRKYNAWMFNRMVDPSEKPFKPENILKFTGVYQFDYPYRRTITMTEPQYVNQRIPLYVAFIVDPALTDEVGSCGYGLTVVGFDRHKHWFVLESRQIKVLPSRAEEVVCEMLLRYHPDRMLIEAAGGDPVLITNVGKFIEREGLDTVPQSFSALQHEQKGERAKHKRIRGMEPFTVRHEISFRTFDYPDDGLDEFRRGYCEDLTRQIDAWPSLVSNDAIDSWAMGKHILQHVPEDQEDFEVFEDRSNPPEYDIVWTDRAGHSHGISADKAAKMAMGPPPGADAARWVAQMEYGESGGGYRPGSRTADYLRRRRTRR